ncbi:2', 3'-cyclic nucleotide 2'-phosphodiesterase, partial [Achromatium sp. WMS1]
PETKAEYALARTKRRRVRTQDTPVIHTSPDVTLKEDLQRRDLTINALAEDKQGRIIDYFEGQKDLEQRILRHVSPAFTEDPIRILRVARFMARYGSLGFSIARETQILMQEMTANGALEDLAPERVWREIDKVLTETRPALFFETLRACGALTHILPELESLWGIPQPSRWHPEIDTGVHTMLVLQMARRLSDDPAIIFAALTHDLGKGETPRIIWPSHRGHEERGVRLIEKVCQRLRVPNRYCNLAKLVARYHGNVHRAWNLRARTVLCILEATDSFRRPERLESMLIACEADYRGRTGFAESSYPQKAQFLAWQRAAIAVDSGLIAASCSGPSMIEQAITRAKLRAIKNCQPIRQNKTN